MMQGAAFHRDQAERARRLARSINRGAVADKPMPIETSEFYRSPNGDRWLLCRETERVFVRHEPNAPSGGRVSNLDIATFLSRGPLNQEHQALLRLITTLVHDRNDGSPSN